MASTVQTPVYPHPQPSFATHENTSSMNDSFGQSALHSFDSSRSVALTPSATPPPPRATAQHNVSFNVNSGSAMNGVVLKGGSFGQYGDVNGHPQSSASYYGQDAEPQIYTAVYSNVPVYEMVVNGTVVMRRRDDSWLNATQILKVAGVDKGKRTKVLDKEVQSGEHEKVQGGYGKYQGTWINYQRGVEFCRQYGVEELLRPLLEYDLRTDGSTSTQNRLETPTKEQAMAAQRKRMYNGMDGRAPSQGSNGTYFKNMSTTAANAVNALSQTQFESPARGMDGRRSVGPARPTHQFQNSQDSLPQGGSQQSMHSMPSQDSFSANNAGSFTYGTNYADYPNGIEGQEPPRKRIRPSPQNSFMTTVDPGLDTSMLDGTTEPDDSFMSHQNQSFAPLPESVVGLPPLPTVGGPEEENKKQHLTALFYDLSRTDFSNEPAFLTLTTRELEMPLDDSGNTALHWAARLAHIPLIKQLIAKGFTVCRTNSGGETPLVAACQVRNNKDNLTFPELLEYLGPSIEVRDKRGRTLLHHIAVSSAMQGRADVGLYYLQSLLEYVVRPDSNTSSQDQSFDAYDYDGARGRKSMDLIRFMSKIVDVRDKSGDTALNLAARTSTKIIIKQLLELGANTQIANDGGLAPIDFGVVKEDEADAPQPPPPPPPPHLFANSSFQGASASSQTSFADTQSEILTSVQKAFTEADTMLCSELQEKQDELNRKTRRLRDEGIALAKAKERLHELQAKSREEHELEQKIANLKRSNAELKGQLSQSNGHLSNGMQEHVVVGEADKGLDFDGLLPLVEQLFPDGEENIDLNGPLSPEQRKFLSLLERAEVLSGRTAAYQQHNADLESRANKLRGMGQELEERYRKIVSICTGVEADKVDDMMESLLQAVLSEQKEHVELGKVRDFLKLVRSGDE